MTRFEPLDSGRARIDEDINGLEIRIRSKTQWFVTVFLCFWLFGWAFGEVMVLTTLLGGGVGVANLFMIAWLGAWTVGGLFCMSVVLWNFAGQERITLPGNALTVQRRVPVLTRSWTYDIAQITKLRTTQQVETALWVNRQMNSGLFSRRDHGSVKFDYGMRTVGFGMELEEAEAAHLLDRLNTRLGR